MLKKRIVPCLDIAEGRTVKGVNFLELIDAGDPVAQAKLYSEEGADELVFLDIKATLENRGTLLDLVKRVAEQVNIPFTVGGGIRTIEDVAQIIRAGADKVSVNSSAIDRPDLITEIKDRFGSQCAVVAIDAKLVDGQWRVFKHGGNTETDWLVMDWAKKVAELGAGEILLTSMNHDGVKTGFALALLRQISEELSIPVIASGGAGEKSHFAEVFTQTKVSAALAASVFHFGEISIPELKSYLQKQNIPIR